MGHSMGTLDFFLLEAGEYLERLDALAQPPAGPFPNTDEFLRIARAFRGSAIMANQHGMARAAQGVESCARALKEARLAWTEAVRGELIRGVDDVKILMRRLRQPEQGDTEKAEAIGIRLDRMSGRASAAMRAAAGPGLDAGARAFVAREAASIGSVLTHTARTLRADPRSRDVLATVGPAMSALRGVAILTDLPPLGDILAAVEAAVKDVSGTPGNVSTDAAEVFDAAARALARAAREVVDLGQPTPDSEEARAFAARLFTALAGGHVVPIQTLFHDDDGPHVLQVGTRPPAGPAPARVEVVSQGEYLSAAAAELTRAQTSVQRDLRLFGIAAALRPLTNAGGNSLAEAIADLSTAARDAIGRGAASGAQEAFAAQMRVAAEALAHSPDTDEGHLAASVAAVGAALAGMTAARTTAPSTRGLAEERVSAEAPPVPVAAPAPAEPAAPALLAAAMAALIEPAPEPAEVPPPEAAPPAPEPAPPVLEEPLPAPEPEPAMAAEPPAAAPLPEPPVPAEAAARAEAPEPVAHPASPVLGEADLATSYMTFEQLLNDRGMPMGSLAELVAGGSAEGATAAAGTHAEGRPVVPIESLAPDADRVVEIDTLLYRGDAALRRARELRTELLAAVQRGDPSLHALINEVLDLVELGLGAGR